MTREFDPARLDVNGFALAGAALSGREPLQAFPRLSAEAAAMPDDASVHWEAVGASRDDLSGAAVAWLHLGAQARIPLVCQRCLTSVEIDLQVDRWFRFVADEATAEAEDEASEEDVLALSRDFDLRLLVEDELLMEIPVTPRHAVCPDPVRLSASDPDFEATEADRPNPFAVLGALRSRTPKEQP